MYDTDAVTNVSEVVRPSSVAAPESILDQECA